MLRTRRPGVPRCSTPSESALSGNMARVQIRRRDLDRRPRKTPYPDPRPPRCPRGPRPSRGWSVPTVPPGRNSYRRRACTWSGPCRAAFDRVAARAGLISRYRTARAEPKPAEGRTLSMPIIIRAQGPPWRARGPESPPFHFSPSRQGRVSPYPRTSVNASFHSPSLRPITGYGGARRAHRSSWSRGHGLMTA